MLADYSARVGEPASLDELLAHAEEHAPATLEARERVGLGDAAVDGAQRFQPYNPELESEIGVGLRDVGLAKAEATLRQRFEVAGERKLRTRVAQRRKEALEAEVDQARWSVHEQVHRIYRLGLIGQERVEIERETLDFTRRLLGIARDRYSAGEEPRTSVILARAELARARQQLVRAWISYVERLYDLESIIGWQESKPPQPTGQLPSPRALPPGAELLEKAFKEDPQLAVLRASLAQARAELALHERAVWPDPTLGIGWEGENLAGSQTNNTLRFVVGVPLPIWNRNQGPIAEARSRIDIIETTIDSREHVLRARVLKRAETVQGAYDQARIYEQEVLPALQTQLELLEEGFDLGELSLLDVMNARDRLLAVQRQHLAALREYFVAVSQLENLLGTAIWNDQ